MTPGTRTEQLLAIDNGTQSVRALVFDPGGTMIARTQVAFDPYVAPHPGWAEQDPAVYWNAVVDACQQLWGQPGVDRDAIVGMAVTAQRGTGIYVDADGQPLRPAITWLDQRRATHPPRIGQPWATLFRLAGAGPVVRELQEQAYVNWIAQYEPETADAHKLLLLSGWLNFRLTGRMADSVSCQVGRFPFDYRRHDWVADGGWQWDALAVMRDQMPELVQAGDTLGQVTPEAAEATGIPAGLPVVAGGADKACEVLGSGCDGPAIGCLSYGTTATVNTTTDRYLEVIRFLPAYPAAEPGRFSPEVQIFRGYWMVSWFKNEFAQHEAQLAAEQGVSAEQVLEEAIRDIPPGSMGLTVQPYWSPGARFPGPEAKGAIIGFGDVHTRQHVYRAILEGLAHALREGAERIQRKTHTRFEQLRVSGGGSQSDTAMQLTADIFDLPAVRPHVHETSGLGAAMIVAVGLGLHDSFATATREMTHVGDTFEPIPPNVELYDGIHRRVYRPLYQRLRPLYRAIREITGYPPR